MQPHQERVVNEKRELDEKLEKLIAFFGGDVFNGLLPEDQDLMKGQATYMKQYSEILGMRIARFTRSASR